MRFLDDVVLGFKVLVGAKDVRERKGVIVVSIHEGVDVLPLETKRRPIFVRAFLDGHKIHARYRVTASPDDPMIDDTIKESLDYGAPTFHQDFARFLLEGQDFSKLSLGLYRYKKSGAAEVQTSGSLDIASLLQKFRDSPMEEVVEAAKVQMYDVKTGQKQGRLGVAIKIVPMHNPNQDFELGLDQETAVRGNVDVVESAA